MEPGLLVSAIGLLLPKCRPGRTTKTPRLQGNLSRRSRSYGHSMGVNTPARKSALAPVAVAAERCGSGRCRPGAIDRAAVCAVRSPPARVTSVSRWARESVARRRSVRPAPAGHRQRATRARSALLYTSDAADEEDSVDLGGRRI